MTRIGLCTYVSVELCAKIAIPIPFLPVKVLPPKPHAKNIG